MEYYSGIETKIFNKKLYLNILCLIIMLFAFSSATTFGWADSQSYQTKTDNGHVMSKSNPVSSFSYGKASAGTFMLTGPKTEAGEKDGVTAYTSTSGLNIGYSYNYSYQTNNKEDWNLTADDGKTVSGYSLNKKIGMGTVLIRKSTDGYIWTNACEPIADYFKNKKIDQSNLYTITDQDLKNGTYFRIIVAYQMQKKTGTEDGFLFFDKDVYDTIYCTECYNFFACYGQNPLSVYDIYQKTRIVDGGTAKNGFTVMKNHSSDEISVTVNGEEHRISETENFYEAGDYTFNGETALGKEYSLTIHITEGQSTAEVTPSVYQSGKKDEYSDSSLLNGENAAGYVTHTRLTIAQNSTEDVVKGRTNGSWAFGTQGSSVVLLLQLDDFTPYNDKGWNIADDTWGKKDKQTILGVQTGTVRTGAVIVQTSTDGVNWNTAGNGRYAGGLYSTDYENHYSKYGDVPIYYPDGKAIQNGLYMRVSYAYKLEKTNSKEAYRFLEIYKFYLCSDDLGAVVFHNLSAEKQLEESLAEMDNAQADLYRRTESLSTGSYTATGFKIDQSLNPLVSIMVLRNGQAYNYKKGEAITEEGKYSVVLTTVLGTTKEETFYVDRMTTKEALAYYFGESFITGKRIYSEGDYPVYEGGLTNWNLLAIDDNHLPLSGQITNDSGEVFQIDADRDAKSGKLTTPGYYEATFCTNGSDIASGDNRVFTFRFQIIQEGSAPGPQVNQKSLEAYSATTITDSNPIYYGISYESAGKGYITLAFATEADARAYANEYEKGTVETYEDGSNYYNGSVATSQKEEYESVWDLTDDIQVNAALDVVRSYFDLSKENSVTTLDEEVLSEITNPRAIELSRSVVIFATGQKEKLTALDALPIISEKPYFYLTPGADGKTEKGFEDFEFVRDQYGCDSYSVTITDCNGKEYTIEYNKGVGEQLRENNCASGIVTITERTVYDDEVSYQAVYLAPNENTATIGIQIYNGNNTTDEVKLFTEENRGEQFECAGFSVKSIQDECDPYCLVIVSKDRAKVFFTNVDNPGYIFADPGDYSIKVVNRLGYYYILQVKVNEVGQAAISFSGEGTENTQPVITAMGKTNVDLPNLQRYGYELEGYKDELGNEYGLQIPEVTFSGSVVLNAVWEAKQYKIILQNEDGDTVETIDAKFGEQYQLPELEVDSRHEFTGWTADGETIADNMYTITEEGDVVLKALTVRTGSQYIPEFVDDLQDQLGTDFNDQQVLIIAGGSAAILLIICIVLIANTHNSKKKKGD